MAESTHLTVVHTDRAQGRTPRKLPQTLDCDPLQDVRFIILLSKCSTHSQVENTETLETTAEDGSEVT